VVTRLITPAVRERGPAWVNRYFAFVDPAGGSGGDSMTLAVAHHDRGADHVMLDVLRKARPPFNPERVAEEFAEVLERYRVRVVVGDRYGGDWPAAAFKRHHIVYKPADRTRSEIYRDVLPLLTSGAVELLDDPRPYAPAPDPRAPHDHGRPPCHRPSSRSPRRCGQRDGRRAAARLGRTAARIGFQNPEFYKKQSLRLSTALTPRVVACAEDLPEHVALPRGCREELEQTLREHGSAKASL
jgi:hypothetical protein